MRLFKVVHYILITLCGVGCFICSHVQASILCTPGTSRTENLQITPMNISAGPDLPLGTIIYRGVRFETDGSNLINCSTTSPGGDTGILNLELGIDLAPYPLSSWSGSPYAGKVYTTNIPGIGVVVGYDDNAVTTMSPYRLGSYLIKLEPGAPELILGLAAKFDLSLIKIGSTPPGNYTINASTFPTAKLFFTGSANVYGLPVTVRRINYSGTLTVSAQTCTTPDVNVPLGVHDASELSGGNNTTSWVEFNINLVNCPEFRGYYPGSNPVNLTAGLYGVSTHNQYGLTLSPTTSIIDAELGIMNVIQSKEAAKGIGIQIASIKSGLKSPFNFNAEEKYTSPSDGVNIINIPMAARYIKVSSNTSPGEADGKITFTINYY